MKKIVLISCVGSKELKRTQAQYLFISPLFKFSLKYADSLNPDKVFILSTQHHLVRPEEEIEPYEVTFKYMSRKDLEKKPGTKLLSKEERVAWGQRVYDQLKEVCDPTTDEIIFLTGEDYIKPLKKYATKNWSYPLDGMRIGERLRFLSQGNGNERFINYCFLLGGHDLEMLTIRALLEEYQVPFADRNLPWGASWKDYQDVTDNIDWDAQTVVGVELSGQKPPGALLIDHHNELAHLPSSLEQVAGLLGAVLSRQQALIAANDKGYIPAMQSLGATDEEIAHIRRMDRQAQGVTEEMERQAEQDLRLINTKNSITVVHTNLPKFSPIADRLQAPRLLIYNSSELTYYGERAAELATVFADEVAVGRAYYGGGPNGFFGFGAGHYGSEAIEQFVDRIRTYFTQYP